MPRARIGEGPPTNTGTRPRPGMVENYTKGPKPGLERDHPPPPTVNSRQKWRGTAPETLSQDRRGTTHKHWQQTRSRSGGKLHQGPSARIGEGPPNTTNS